MTNKPSIINSLKLRKEHIAWLDKRAQLLNETRALGFKESPRRNLSPNHLYTLIAPGIYEWLRIGFNTNEELEAAIAAYRAMMKEEA